MRCSKCRCENPADNNFCARCGNPLARLCAKCGAENAPASNFCGKCGASLAKQESAASGIAAARKSAADIRVVAETSALEGERKTVTALFADIKGSTELMEDLDPEEARAIIDPALKLMIDAVHRYDGYVVQSTGDGIFALFGAPVAHEDHPQRALYAALRLQEELARYSARLREGGDLPIEGRVGVNTGEVVVRSITTGEGQTEYTPIGHTTNLASRMQALAPTGSIAVSENTRKLCEGYFILKPLGPTRVKGVSEPVNLYEVTGLGPLRTRLQRAVGRGLTKFVGREHEMETLKRALVEALNGHGQIVAVMADAGVGKSRLFFEFKAGSQAECMVLETFSISHGKASAYLPVLDLFRNYFDISTADDERKRREKVAGKIAILDRSLEDTLPYLFSLLGIFEGDDPMAQMDGQVKKRRTLEAITRIVLRESLNQPLMVIFEDLHWIDEHTQELLNLLADAIGTAKILLLVNYRPEYLHQWGNKTYYTQIRVDPLGKESAAEMLSVLLGDGKDLIALKRLIIERTDGNPFFMEEIVQALFEDGVLQRNGTVKLARSMNAVKAPATVQAVLASRIDRLPPAEKELLQTLAVIGREFELSLVRRLVAADHDDLNGMLGDLQTAEFIYEQPADGDIKFIFKHALTLQVAYNSLLIDRRKLLHERAGEALAVLFADQLDEHLTQLVHHFSHSDNAAKAVEYLGRAGQQAMRFSAYADAITSFSTAIELLQKMPDSSERAQRELTLQLAIGPALIVVKGYGAPETERAYTRACDLCERVDDDPKSFSALLGLWVVYLVRGELRTAYGLAQRLLRRAQITGEETPLMYAHQALGTTSFWMGELLLAKEHSETSLSLYDPERHRLLALRYGGIDTKVNSLLYEAWILWHLGYPDQALNRSSQGLTLAQGISHPHSLAYAELFVAILHQLRREARATREKAESMNSLSAESGLTGYFAFATALHGWAMAVEECNEDGIAQISEGLAAARATGEEWRRYFLWLLAEACMKTGRLDDSSSALTEALAAANEHEDRHHEAEMYRLKGELLLKQDVLNARKAQSCFERAIEIARKQSAKSWELRATMSLARLLKKQGSRDEARAMLAGIYNWFTEGFDTADLKDAKALLDELAD